MVEIENRYKILDKKFGYINWLGFFTLYQKEILRFLKVAIQTIISPLVSALLFLMVLSLAIGNDRGGACHTTERKHVRCVTAYKLACFRSGRGCPTCGSQALNFHG